MLVGGKWGRLSPLPCHHPRSLRPRTLRHCPRKGSKVGVGEDVGVLAQQVGWVIYCPIGLFCTVNNKVYWWRTVKGDTEARNSLYASSARGACPAVVSRARCPRNVTMCAGRSAQGVYLCTRHCPVESSHRIDDVCLAGTDEGCLCRDPGDLTRLCYPGSRHRKQLNMPAKLTWRSWLV
jgi:hypothetical protein